MTNRQARIFAVASTAISALVFLVLTLDTHRQIESLTNADKITPEVIAGMDVWHQYNCINCHTLFGEGAYYAPDLTKITDLRGTPYLKAFIANPSQFYDEDKHRRLMPDQGVTDAEIDDLLVFLEWVSKVDNQGWPPRPIMVTGSFVPGGTTVHKEDGDPNPDLIPPGTTPVDSNDDARAKGEAIFRTAVPACNACHSTAPGADMAGPTLAGVASRAAALIGSEDYKGSATDVAGYVRESIVEPSTHLVPGQMYSAGGTSFMPTGYADSLTEEQIEQLTEFLLTFK